MRRAYSLNTSDAEHLLISVIIPTYNHARFIGRAIESVLNQTYKKFEAIIVDNYSDDGTEGIVNSYNDNRIKYLKFRNFGVIAASRNYGISHSKGEYIAFLDSDDWWYPKKLEVSRKYLNNADIIYHPLDVYTPKGKKILRKTRVRRLKKPVFLDLIRNGNALPNSSVTVKRSIIKEAGGLTEDKSIVAFEDYDLWLRISKLTDKFTCIPKTLGAYYWNGGNTTEASERQIARVDALYSRHAKFLSDEDKAQMHAWVSYYKGIIKLNNGFLNDAFKLFKNALKSKRYQFRLTSIIMLADIIRRRYRLTT